MTSDVPNAHQRERGNSRKIESWRDFGIQHVFLSRFQDRPCQKWKYHELLKVSSGTSVFAMLQCVIFRWQSEHKDDIWPTRWSSLEPHRLFRYHNKLIPLQIVHELYLVECSNPKYEWRAHYWRKESSSSFFTMGHPSDNNWCFRLQFDARIL